MKTGPRLSRNPEVIQNSFPGYDYYNTHFNQMKILLTGATGYIAQRLLPVLLGNGHEVICCVRDKARFDTGKYRSSSIQVIEVDFLKPETLVMR